MTFAAHFYSLRDVIGVAVAQACLSGLRLFAATSTIKDSISVLFLKVYYAILMSRLRRIEDTDRIFFITTNLDPGAAPLAPAERGIVLDWLGKVRVRHRFLLLAYVVMPNHAHALLAVVPGSLQKIMHGWK